MEKCVELATPQFDRQDDVDFMLICTRHPHIARNIAMMWGSVDLHDYLMGLFNDTRDGTRRGFEQNVASAIFRLLHLHGEKFPDTIDRINSRYDVWCV